MHIARRSGPRPAVVGTCTFRQVGSPSPEVLLRESLAMVDAMAAAARDRGWHLDLAVVPEASFQFAGADARSVAESPDGATVRACAAKARELGCYLTAPFLRRHGDRVCNSVALVGRDGGLLGWYDKVHPVMVGDGSLEYGVTPGRAYPVFDLDFGRVGVQICWDVAFADGWQALADQDAELVVFPTNPAVPTALRGYAWRHGYYIATSTVHPPGLIVDPLGRILSETTADRQALVERIDLDYRVLHSNCMWDWSLDDHPEYQGRVSISWDRDGHEYLASSLDPALPVAEFLRREGILTGRQRMRRNVELLDRAWGTRPPMPEGPIRD